MVEHIRLSADKVEQTRSILALAARRTHRRLAKSRGSAESRKTKGQPGAISLEDKIETIK